MKPLAWFLAALLTLAATAQPEPNLELKISQQVNQARQRQGLAPLKLNGKLADVARQHSQEMLELGYFSHRSPVADYATLSERVHKGGCSELTVGENLYKAQGMDSEEVIEDVVEAWLNSPAHRHNLLSSNYNTMGIGLVREGETFVITQVFSRQTAQVTHCAVTPSQAGYQVSLQGQIVEGANDGAIFFSGKRVAEFHADRDGRFACQVTVPGLGKLELGQSLSPREWSIENVIDLSHPR